jgi:isopentenyl diphosphate isomerase/L-lactate dehydrogenase-like FMN-dependent dehydrogenase
MTLADGAQAVKYYLDYVKSDLRRVMFMTAYDHLDEISSDSIVKNNYYLFS